MLTNIRPIRSITDAYADAGSVVIGFRPPPGGFGNVAYFVVRASIRSSAEMARQAIEVGEMEVQRVGVGLFTITARNSPHAAHSETRCIQAFMQHFGNNPRHNAQVEYVFTEREPCHEARNANSCLRRLELFLAQFGQRDRATPVRFVTRWMSKREREVSRDKLGGDGKPSGKAAQGDVSSFRKQAKLKVTE